MSDINDDLSKVETWNKLEYLAMDLRRYGYDNGIQGDFREKIRTAADVLEELAEFLKDGK